MTSLRFTCSHESSSRCQLRCHRACWYQAGLGLTTGGAMSIRLRYAVVFTKYYCTFSTLCKGLAVGDLGRRAFGRCLAKQREAVGQAFTNSREIEVSVTDRSSLIRRMPSTTFDCQPFFGLLMMMLSAAESYKSRILDPRQNSFRIAAYLPYLIA